MATLLSKKLFAEHCNMASSSIPAYISRKKIVQDDDGMIDIEHPINREFINLRKSKVKPQPAQTSLDDQFFEKKTLIESEKKEIELEIKKIELAKLQNKYVETDLVVTLLKTHIGSIQNELKHSLEALIQDIMLKSRVTDKAKIAKSRMLVIEAINKSCEKARVNTNKELEMIFKS